MIGRVEAAETVHIVGQARHRVQDVRALRLVVIAQVELVGARFPALDVAPDGFGYKAVVAAVIAALPSMPRT